MSHLKLEDFEQGKNFLHKSYDSQIQKGRKIGDFNISSLHKYIGKEVRHGKTIYIYKTKSGKKIETDLTPNDTLTKHLIEEHEKLTKESDDLPDNVKKAINEKRIVAAGNELIKHLTGKFPYQLNNKTHKNYEKFHAELISLYPNSQKEENRINAKKYINKIKELVNKYLL